MAAIRWTSRTLSGKRVRLTGSVTLSCGHTISDGAQVRDAPAAIEQGKETVARLLTSLTQAHMRECRK